MSKHPRRRRSSAIKPHPHDIAQMVKVTSQTCHFRNNITTVVKTELFKSNCCLLTTPTIGPRVWGERNSVAYVTTSSYKWCLRCKLFVGATNLSSLQDSNTNQTTQTTGRSSCRFYGIQSADRAALHFTTPSARPTSRGEPVCRNETTKGQSNGPRIQTRNNRSEIHEVAATLPKRIHHRMIRNNFCALFKL